MPRAVGTSVAPAALGQRAEQYVMRAVTSSPFDHLPLDANSHTVIFEGVRVRLSRGEFAILQALLESRGVPLSREELRERLYGAGREILGNPVEVHVNHLRAKLSPDLIRTLRGVGYVIPAPGDRRFQL